MKNNILRSIKAAIAGVFLRNTNDNLVSYPAKAGTEAERSAKARKQAIDILVARGTSLDDALVIVKAMEEWQLDYSLAHTTDFKVTGNSVWINNEE